MFYSLIKKELKAQLNLTLLGVVGSLALFYLFINKPSLVPHQFSSFEWDFSSIPLSIANSGYLRHLSKLSYVMALLLGIMMSYTELMDRWQFLIQQPLSKKQILLGKMFAGGILLGTSIVVPYILLAIWSAMPGHYPAPWSFTYLYPGLEIFARSFLVFTGALIAGFFVKGRTIYPLIILGGTLILVECSQNSYQWLTSILCLLIALLFQIKLALGKVFSIKSSERLASSVFTLLTITFVLLIVSGEKISNIFKSSLEDRGIQKLHYVSFSHGEPEETSFESFRYYGFYSFYRELCAFSLRDNRKENFIHLDIDSRYENYLRRVLFCQSIEPKTKSFQFGKTFFDYYAETPLGLVTYNAYYLQQERLFAFYNTKTCEFVSYLGKNGFFRNLNQKNIQRFSTLPKLSLQNSSGMRKYCFMTTDEDFCLIDLNNLKLTSLYHGKIYAANRVYENLNWSKNKKNKEKYPENWPVQLDVMVLHTEESILIYDVRTAQFLTKIKIPEKIAKDQSLRNSSLTLTFLENKVLGVIIDKRFNNSKTEQDDSSNIYAYKITADGKIISEQVFSLPPLPTKLLIENKAFLRILSPGVTLFSLSAIYAYFAAENLPLDSLVSFKEKQFGVVAGILLFLKSFLCGLLGYFLLRFRNLSKAAYVGWSFFAFLGGIPALLTLCVIIVKEEKRTSCTQCKTKIVPSYSLCPKCNTSWPKAETREIDIFVKQTQA